MKPEETVVEMFVGVDSRDWDKVKLCFEDQVLLDYSSMNGLPPAVVCAEEIIQSWKNALPLFKATHHQLGNMLSYVNQLEATVFCYGTATHYLEHKDGNVWTVVGSYNFNLKETEGVWRIARMKFNYKYQDGNTKLHEPLLMKRGGADSRSWFIGLGMGEAYPIIEHGGSFYSRKN